MDIDFFTSEEQPVLHVMNQGEFFEKSKTLLNKILQEYSGAWSSKPLKDSEFPDESICDKCTGCGLFKDETGEERECVQDKQEGWCYYRFFDEGQFGAEVSQIVENETIYELACVDELSNNEPNDERTASQQTMPKEPNP